MKKGFTLSELLLSLTIVGVIAVLTVPVLLGNVQNKTFAVQVKNMSATIEQLAQDELVAKRTRDLSGTDFGDPEKLLSDNHFTIVKTCTSDNSLKDCWKTSATDNKDKVTYKALDKSDVTISAGNTVVLKNGVILRYSVSNLDNVTGDFLIDINGSDKPNIAGRDLFQFYVTPKGYLVDEAVAQKENKTLSQKITSCKSNVGYCYGALAENNWKMDY